MMYSIWLDESEINRLAGAINVVIDKRDYKRRGDAVVSKKHIDILKEFLKELEKVDEAYLKEIKR